MMKRRITIAVLAAALAGTSSVANAQAGRIFKERDLNEAALVDALTPDVTVRTRSIRVQPSGDTVHAKPPSASLLITFETNSAELTPNSRRALDIVARALGSDKLAEFGFLVEGHADPRGSDELNMRLSQARAESVVQYLVGRHGLSRQRLDPLGKGETELANLAVPTAPENRRVTIKTKIE